MVDLTKSNTQSWTCPDSGLLEPSHTCRPTAGHYRVSTPSSFRSQEYCKNIMKYLVSAIILYDILTKYHIHIKFKYIRKAQLLSSWYGCWKTRGRRGCLQLFLVARKQNWREESRGAIISLEISIGGKSTIGRFQLFRLKIKMAALVKKAPALLNAAMEIAKPQLNTFLRYAKVKQSRKNFWPSDILILRLRSIIFEQVELAPPSPGEIPVAIADISTKVWICFDSRWINGMHPLKTSYQTEGSIDKLMTFPCF